MRLQFQITIVALLLVASLSALAVNCAKCGAVAPAGWKFCQRCKNEQDRIDREEARKKRRAEAEEAQRKKDAAERAAKLKKLQEAKVATEPPTPAGAPSASSTAAKAATESKPLAEACPGLFGIKLGQAIDATFSKKTVEEDGRSVERHFFMPAKKFRGFEEYSVRVGASGVYEIAAHRRYVRGAGVDAKQAANAEFDDCAQLLGKKFGKPMVEVEESLSGRASQIRFVSPEGLVCRTVTIRMARNMDSALANRYNDNSDSLMMEMDKIYDVWIVATDNIGLLREQRAKEASDLDAL
jgi:hypothetical protein